MANPTPSKAEAQSPRPITYQDTAFTSRILIMNSGRQLAVAAGKVTVSSADAEALAFLDSDPAFQRLPE